MKQMVKENLLVKLDQFISNLDNNDNDMVKLIEEVSSLEKLILKNSKDFDYICIDTVISLKSILNNIKENQDAIELLKTVAGNDKKLSQKMILKLQEKGINIQNIMSEIKQDIAKLESVCKNYNEYRENQKKKVIVLNNQPSLHIIKKLNVRVASFVLATITSASAIGYATFKLLDKDNKKIDYEVCDEIDDNNLVDDYYSDIIEMDEPIIAKTTKVEIKPIVSTLPENSEFGIIVSDDFSNYPKLNCNNKHVYYRAAKSYNFTDEELNILMKVVTKESASNNPRLSYDEAYIEAMAVTSTVLNRFEDKQYYNSHGTDLIAQLSAPSQFTTYQGALKMSDDEIPDVVKDAVMDTLNGVRNHEFVQFRANSNKAPGRILITPHGNNHFDVMNPLEEIKEIEYVKK